MNYSKAYFSMLIVLGMMIVVQSFIIDMMDSTIDKSYDLIKKQEQIIEMKEQEMDSTKKQFRLLLESLEFISKVDVTMYNAVPGQTDNTPFITASGARINPIKASEHRWIAISRDLQERWGGPLDFGDIVYIKGTDEYDGLYMVQDNMNARYKNRIDILRTDGEEQFAFIGKNIELYRVKEHEEFQYVNHSPDDKWERLNAYMEGL